MQDVGCQSKKLSVKTKQRFFHLILQKTSKIDFITDLMNLFSQIFLDCYHIALNTCTTRARMQGEGARECHTPKKKPIWQKSRKKWKKSQNQKSLQKLPQCYIQMGQKWGVFNGVTPSPPIFFEIRTAPKLILHMPLVPLEYASLYQGIPAHLATRILNKQNTPWK